MLTAYAGDGTDFSVFVGDLGPEVTDYVLQENFRRFFPSVRSAKVHCSHQAMQLPLTLNPP